MDYGETYSATDGDAQAARSWQTYERWIAPAGQSALTVEFPAAVADYIGVAAHTLGQGVAVKFEVREAGEWLPVTLATLDEMVTPDNEALMVLLEPREVTGVRLLVNADQPASVGKIAVGKVLTMLRPFYSGHSPIMLSRQTDRKPSVSESGEWLGMTVTRQGRSGGAQWQHLPANWYRQNFDPFVAHAKRHPFFFAWNGLKFPDCVYAYLEGDVVPSNMGIRDLMSVSINMIAYSDGTEPYLSRWPQEWLDFYPESTEQPSIIDLAINQEWPE